MSDSNTFDSRSEDERKRDRQMLELLNELRVALPGVQILFAFLLDRAVHAALPGPHGVPARRLLRHAAGHDAVDRRA